MANICNYEIWVKGSKQATLFVYAAMPCYNEKQICGERGTEAAYELHFTGDCKWHVDSYCRDAWDKEPLDLNAMVLLDESGYVNEEMCVDYWYYTLREKSRVAACEIAVYCWSDESDFMEFALYKDGAALKKGNRKYAKSIRFDWQTMSFVTPKPKKPVPVKTPDVPEEELWETETLKNGTLRICAYHGSAAQAVVPGQIGDQRVTIIGKKTFSAKHTKDRSVKKYLRTELKQVILPEGITAIEQSAFEDCRGLESISIPMGVTKVGRFAFRDCASLTEIVLPGSIKKMGGSVFEDCPGLTKAVLPKGIKEIGEFLFHRCSNLGSVVVPDGVTEIKHAAFWECIRLNDVTIPGSVQTIIDTAFTSCKNLTIHAPAGSYAETWAKEKNIPFVAE